MQLKHAVQEQAEEVEAIAKQIHADKESLRILEAEWAYLTSPRALQELSIEFLALMPPSPKQVVGSVADIPMRRNADVVSGDTSVLLPSAHKKPGSSAAKMNKKTDQLKAASEETM